jgi:hypothetical protein
MNRMIRAAASAALLVSGLGSVGCVNTGTTGGGCSSGGCGGSGIGGGGIGGARGEGHGPIGDCWRKFNDPCYPDRYEYAARQAVIAPFAQQVVNGHVLNQTIFNYYFELNKDVLTTAGMEKLASLSRTRPAPDAKLYLQTARDLPTDTDPAKIPDLRTDLDARRAVAIRKYLASQPSFAPVAWDMELIDPVVPGLATNFGEFAYRGSIQGYKGNVSGGGTGVLGTGSGGASGGYGPPAAGGTTGGGPR